MPSLPLTRRQGNPNDSAGYAISSTSLGPIYIAGFALAGMIVICIVLTLLVKTMRKRSRKNRESKIAGAFLSIKGLVRESDPDEKNEPLPEHLLSIQGSTFSRTQLDASIVLPEKTLSNLRPSPAREEILNFHRQSGTFPRPFAPFSFALSATASPSSPSHLRTSSRNGQQPVAPTSGSGSPSRPAHSRNHSPAGRSSLSRPSVSSLRNSIRPDSPPSSPSCPTPATANPHSDSKPNPNRSLTPTAPAHAPNPFSRFSALSFSSSAPMSRFSVISSAGSMNSTSSSALPPSILTTTGHERKVRQLFDPVLPDEMLITHVGERLTLVQSFDDGWCLVGRQNSLFKGPATQTSLFKSNAGTQDQDGDNIELGVIPAWCFLKVVKGLRAERPIRNTSLGVTVQVERPGFSSREDVISWSNF